MSQNEFIDQDLGGQDKMLADARLRFETWEDGDACANRFCCVCFTDTHCLGTFPGEEFVLAFPA